jgi:hypothetical protein
MAGAVELAGVVEAALRALHADAAADAAYVLLAGGNVEQPPPTWRAVLAVMDEFGVRGEDLSRVAARAGVPYVLGLDDREARAVLGLLRELGFGGGQMVRVIAQRPSLLSDVAAVRERVALLRTLSFTDRDVRNVATKWPGLLALDAGRAGRVIDFLCRSEVGFTRASLRSLVRRAPWLLVYDVREHVAPAVGWLRRSFLDGAPGVSLEQIVRASPHVLGMSPAAMSAVLDFLRDGLYFDDHCVVSVVRQFPPILTSSVDGVLAPAVRFLSDELALGEDDIARIVRAFPAILTLDVQTDMRPNVDFFRARGVRNVGRIVARLPPVLSYDIETNLAPKLDYLVTGLGLTAYDILRFPGYFSYSLTGVIEPRTRFLQKCGIPVTQSGLNMALAPTDEAFCERVAFAPIEHYTAFRIQLREKRAYIAAAAVAAALVPVKGGLDTATAPSPVAVGSPAAAAGGGVPSAAAVALELSTGRTRVAGQPKWPSPARASGSPRAFVREGDSAGADVDGASGDRRGPSPTSARPGDTLSVLSSLSSLPFERSVPAAPGGLEWAVAQDSAGDGEDAEESVEAAVDLSRPSPLPVSLRPLNPPRPRRRKRRLRATDARLPWSPKALPTGAPASRTGDLEASENVRGAGLDGGRAR